jgi:DNA-binding GntR family transcriptional regulator
MAGRDRPIPISYDEALVDHAAILTSMRNGDREAAGKAAAFHVGHPALVHLAAVAPLYEPRAVREALRTMGVQHVD